MLNLIELEMDGKRIFFVGNESLWVHEHGMMTQVEMQEYLAALLHKEIDLHKVTKGAMFEE